MVCGGWTFSRGGFISAYDLYASMYDTVSEKVQELYKREQQPELTVLKGLGSFAVASIAAQPLPGWM